jgi:hypothetical protein
VIAGSYWFAGCFQLGFAGRSWASGISFSTSYLLLHLDGCILKESGNLRTEFSGHSMVHSMEKYLHSIEFGLLSMSTFLHLTGLMRSF